MEDTKEQARAEMLQNLREAIEEAIIADTKTDYPRRFVEAISARAEKPSFFSKREVWFHAAGYLDGWCEATPKNDPKIKAWVEKAFAEYKSSNP